LNASFSTYVHTVPFEWSRGLFYCLQYQYETSRFIRQDL